MKAPTTAVKAPDEVPAGIAIEGGVVTTAELLVMVTTDPLDGAAAESVTVQVALPAAVNEPGRQTSELTVGPTLGAVMLTETLCEDGCVPPKVAVRVAVWPAAPADAVAMNEAELRPAAMLN